MVAGVAGGLAEYFDLDPTVVRLVYAIVTVLTGFIPGLVLYAGMALTVPAGSGDGAQTALDGNRAALAGVILVTAGVLILLGNLGLFTFWNWARWWPVLLIVLGAALLLRRER